MTNHLTMGTRGSSLALKQAQWVADRIRDHDPDINLTIEVIKTSGDREHDKPLAQIGGKGVFVKELELHLRECRIDLAVHSLKDLPVDLPPELVVAAVPGRASPYDAMVCGRWPSLQALPDGATVGTSSPRRAAQLRAHRSGLRIVDLRGNIDTRLRRVAEGAVDAAILACAGLERLGRAGTITQVLTEDLMVPAVGQGALAVEIRATDTALAEFLQGVTDAYAETEVSAERAFLRALGGGCQVPIGALARVLDTKLMLTGCVCSPDGTTVLRSTLVETATQPDDLGRRAADALLDQGADEIIAAAI